MTFTITPTASMSRWAAEVSSQGTTFTADALFGEQGAPPLRVWPGQGFSVAADQLPGLYGAIVEVMKKAAYWNCRATLSADIQAWSAPDRSDATVTVTGPANPAECGSTTSTSLTVEHATLRGLRIRLRSYLAEATAPERAAPAPLPLT